MTDRTALTDEQYGAPVLPPFDGGTFAIVLCVSLLVYAISMSPVVFWGDSAEFALSADHLQLTANARAYPLHRFLSYVFGLAVADPAFGANFVSVVFGAVTTALLFEAGRLLGGSTTAGIAAALTTGLAHTFWTYSGIAEVYTLHTAFMAGAFVLLLRAPFGEGRESFWFGLLAGVSLLHHRLVFFAAPGLLIWLVAGAAPGMRVRSLVRATLGFAVGAIPFVVLCVLHSRTPPQGTTDPALWWVRDVFMGGDSNTGFLFGEGRKSAAESAVYLLKFLMFNLPGVTLPLALWGLFRAPRMAGRGVAAALYTLFALHLIFPFRYDWTGDQYAFLIPLYPIASLSVAVAIGSFELSGRGRLAVVATSLVAAGPLVLYTLLGLTPLGPRLMPGLTPDAAQRFYIPVHLGDREPEEWCRDTLERIPASEGRRETRLLHCRWGDGKVYQYLQATEGVRPDVKIEIWYGGEIPLLDLAAGCQFVTVSPGERALPGPVGRVIDRLIDRGGGLYEVRPR